MTFATTAMVLGGAALGSAAIGAFGASQAAGQQAGAANSATQAQYNFYNQTRADLLPYMGAGTNALSALSEYTGVGPGGTFNAQAPGVRPFTLNDFTASPAYQFNLQQGQLALDKAANARSNYYAPQTLQDVSRFSQGLASNEFMNAYNMYNQQQGNVYNRLSGITNLGQASAANVGLAGGNAAQGISQTMQGLGNAQAAGTVGIANALQGGIQGGINAYGGYQNMLQLNQLIAALQGGTASAQPNV